ncbi:MAG: HEPN domain-containing protein [Desulfobacteria bacterium]
MPPDPGTPADWLRHARSDLSLARKTGDPDTLLETLCFHAQQATEKCFKAILVSRGIPPPATHNLKTLVEKFPPDLGVPADVADAIALTDYAVTTRYPGVYEEVGEDEYRDAMRMAECVMAWVERVI